MEERRQSNKQITIEKLDKDVHEMSKKFATKEELKDAVDNRSKDIKSINEILHYDGGLVYKCDLAELKELIEKQGKSIDKQGKKLNEIYPKVSKDIEKAHAYQIITDDWNSKVISGVFWGKVVAGIVFFSILVYTVVSYVKSFLK